MNFIDSIAYKSRISNVKTGNKLALGIFFLVLSLFVDSLLARALAFILMSVSTIYFAKMKISTYLKILLVPTSFLLIGIVTILFGKSLNPKDMLICISIFNQNYGIRAQSVKFCALLFLKTMSCFSCLLFISFNTPMNGLFEFMRKAKTPRVIVDILELMYRLIFVIGEEASQIFIAQSSRLGYKNFSSSMDSFSLLTSQVFVKSFRRIEKMEYALESRGFDGDLSLVCDREIRSPSFIKYAFSISLILIIVSIVERIAK